LPLLYISSTYSSGFIWHKNFII